MYMYIYTPVHIYIQKERKELFSLASRRLAECSPQLDARQLGLVAPPGLNSDPAPSLGGQSQGCLFIFLKLTFIKERTAFFRIVVTI